MEEKIRIRVLISYEALKAFQKRGIDPSIYLEEGAKLFSEPDFIEAQILASKTKIRELEARKNHYNSRLRYEDYPEEVKDELMAAHAVLILKQNQPSNLDSYKNMVLNVIERHTGKKLSKEELMILLEGIK